MWSYGTPFQYHTRKYKSVMFGDLEAKFSILFYMQHSLSILSSVSLLTRFLNQWQTCYAAIVIDFHSMHFLTDIMTLAIFWDYTHRDCGLLHWCPFKGCCTYSKDKLSYAYINNNYISQKHHRDSAFPAANFCRQWRIDLVAMVINICQIANRVTDAWLMTLSFLHRLIQIIGCHRLDRKLWDNLHCDLT